MQHYCDRRYGAYVRSNSCVIARAQEPSTRQELRRSWRSLQLVAPEHAISTIYTLHLQKSGVRELAELRK